MAHYVLSVAGSDPENRVMLYGFVIGELKILEKLQPHRIKASRNTLENHKNIILLFTKDMDK
jgi:hypothetical protein